MGGAVEDVMFCIWAVEIPFHNQVLDQSQLRLFYYPIDRNILNFIHLLDRTGITFYGC